MAFRFPARWRGREHGPNPLTEAVIARRASGADVLDLTVSNPTLVGLPVPLDWPRHLGGDGAVAGQAGAESLNTYDPHPQGLESARRAIAAYYRDRGADVDPDALFLTAGTSEAYGHLFKLLCEPGDTVLVPRPSYPLLDTLAELAGLNLGHYPLMARDGDDAISWRLDREALLAALTPRVRILCVVHPNNPTGSPLEADDAAWLVRVAEARKLAVVVDEVFADYRFDGGSTALVTSKEALVFTLNGLSKLVGLPQLKLAWIHVSGPAADLAIAKDALEWMCDAALSVGTAPQLACAPLLARRAEFQGPIRARLEENLAALRAVADSCPRLKPLWPKGGWCVPVRCAGIEDDETFAIRLVEEAGVIAQPGYFFDFDDEETLVVSLLTPPELFREGLARIVKTLG